MAVGITLIGGLRLFLIEDAIQILYHPRINIGEVTFEVINDELKFFQIIAYPLAGLPGCGDIGGARGNSFVPRNLPF